ncbi:MAG: enoyl-CoA hydratase/isomerase family protein [Thermomicrobiales bacterium]|nr:enoyl-CoA hydratase/isomerase family protein [Thermomicrobiales bacterium]
MSAWTPADERISCAIDDHVARVTIARPEKLNAIAPEMLAALRETFDHLDRTPAVRVILLDAAGQRAFSVGADITAWAALEPIDMWRRWVRDGNAAIDAIAAVRQPTIAVIDGLALGGGLELALACDLRIASEGARFGSPEVRIATLPGWGGTARLVRTIGLARTKQLVFTGDQIDAATALSWGLVNEVASADELGNRAAAIAESIARNAPIAVQLAKAVLDSDGGPGPALEAIAGALSAFTDDGREGIASFREKRAAEFSDG